MSFCSFTSRFVRSDNRMLFLSGNELRTCWKADTALSGKFATRADKVGNKTHRCNIKNNSSFACGLLPTIFASGTVSKSEI